MATQRVGFEIRARVELMGEGVADSAHPSTSVFVTRAHFEDLGVGVGDEVWLHVARGAARVQKEALPVGS